MSRSWERRVRRNSAQINKQRKKTGQEPFSPIGDKSNPNAPARFKGRNFISPILLLLFVILYAIITMTGDKPAASGSTDTMNWMVIAGYSLIALMFFLRRPYLQVGPDHVQTRRMMGDKRLGKDQIQSISVQKGYVIIQPVKGGNWVFSRMLNRYPIEPMSDRLETMAAAHGIPFHKQ
ncbi:hypothetical protein M3223_16500 [Paenibacillus pasadenensis]|uniref:hypothetical protein n=1 Tax=Paenibacillus pasadenensis TaxID=217090 RepID=UPI00203AE335|nr:hypothetical protein [Paenibacillus pasadenensis]MCM3748957.1 hypothetical protein [Paenibacillus pasadenensis]